MKILTQKKEKRTSNGNDRVCDKNDDKVGTCCTETKSCDVGHGDCDTDEDCLGDLRCGLSNCEPDFGWGGPLSDCCYQP